LDVVGLVRPVSPDVAVNYVFHQHGQPIRKQWFYRQWKLASKRAGLPGKLFHDYRRTVVRNLVRAGVTESVAMAWTGYKTRSVFESYNIVSRRDLADAAEKLVSHVKGHRPKVAKFEAM
jgi:integrase